MKAIFSFSLALLVIISCNCCMAQTDVNSFEKGLSADVQLLDVRSAEEYKQGHIENAMLANINDNNEFNTRIAALDKNKPVYVYCLGGGRSHRAAEILKKYGFKEVVDLKGGINAWKSAGKKVEGVPGFPPITAGEYKKMITAANLVFVDYGAVWCPPCRKMAPVIEGLEKKFGSSVKVIRIDATSQASLMEAHKVEGIPTFILYKNGTEVWRGNGVIEKVKLEAVIQKSLKG
jgi:thioredoxin